MQKTSMVEGSGCARRTCSVEQAAHDLGISRGLAYELARQGKLPGCIRLGRRFVVSVDALERALAGENAEKA